MLEAPSSEPALLQAWRARVESMRAALGWSGDGAIVAEPLDGGAALAIAAPRERLFAATELNEWAWQGAAWPVLRLPLPLAPGHPASADIDSARETLRRLAAAEARPRVEALVAEARARDLPVYEDDELLSIGAGRHGQSWDLAQVPAPEAVDWNRLASIPTALVTGSNGKTTTVRLLAAMATQAGRVAGFNCTDGVFVDGVKVLRGDYSGPGGAREVLRHPRVQAAVLETARGGLLRRGLAVRHAQAAIVTNISADHFGEYGVESLQDLADAKLVVARAIGADGRLVLNADDPVLRERARRLTCPLGWFSLDGQAPAGAEARCELRDGHLWLHAGGADADLGVAAEFPLALGGAARYNLANLAGAALLAASLGAPVEAIRGVLSSFGARRADNPGRLERWRIDGAWVLVDYAHNPEGLQGLLQVAEGLRSTAGRLGLLLGQAGNREDADIARLAGVAAAARPARVLLKDIAGYLRGREDGEVGRLLARYLQDAGVKAADIAIELSEVEAARQLVGWSRPGDVIVLPVHNLEARDQLADWLDQRSAQA